MTCSAAAIPGRSDERRFRRFSSGLPNALPLRALHWASSYFGVGCLLHSQGYSSDRYGRFPWIMGLGAAASFEGLPQDSFSGLKQFSDAHPGWLFGFLSYDLKNQIERLTSENFDGIGMPLMHFFSPVILLLPCQEGIEIGCLPGFGSLSDPENVFNAIVSTQIPCPSDMHIPQLRARVSKTEYLDTVSSILNHIQQGDIYEMNYCTEHYAVSSQADPLLLWERLSLKSPAPFSAYYRIDDKHLVCASPERFLAKRGNKLVSQPIKGTMARGKDPLQDEALKHQLYLDPKERSENVMIVDLVRNDLSRTAVKDSVKVEELFGIYSFRQVHQMISTVVSELRPGVHFTDAIRHAFPMGSMTGAPKVRTMQLIEQYEKTLRGLYSGAVGYISPEGDFDFNVVIRSILYNSGNRYLSYMAGGAITIGSVPEKEYQECLLKASAMQKAIFDL